MPNQEVGAAYVSVYPKLGNEWSKVGDDAGKIMGGGLLNGAVAASVAVGNLVAGAIQKTVQLVMEDLDEGIARVDTLEQFPKVMENMGFSAELAKTQIADIVDHLRGLPTATQDLLPFVQMLASINDDLEKSTKFGLAWNDMLIANGASTAAASRSMEMFSKMLASGEYNAQRWQSITEAMPGSLNRVAEYMLGAGKKADDLGVALNNDEVSFSELMDAIIALDENGTEGMRNFHDQALIASEGIQTSIDNMHNRIIVGWQKILQAIGSTQIRNVIEGFGDSLNSAMGEIANFIVLIHPYVDEAMQFIGELADSFGKGFVEGFQYVADAVPWDFIIEAFGRVYDGLRMIAESGVVQKITELLGGFAGMIVSGAIGGALSLLAGLINGVSFAFEHAGEIVQIFAELFDWMLQGVYDAINGGVQGIIGVVTGFASAIWDDIISPLVTEIWDGFSSLADNLYSGISGAVEFVGGIIGGLRDTVVGIWDNMKTSADEAFSGIRSFMEDPIGKAKDFIDQKIQDIIGFFTGLGERITKAIGDIHFPQPQIDWEPLEIGGVKTISIPKVTWHAKGGYFDDPTLIGVGEAGGELLLPQSGGVMDPFADTVAERVGEDDDRIIAWLDANLPYIIARYTPTIGQRDFDRMARRATA